MLILGIILTILGAILFQWFVKAMSGPFYNRPLIFHKTIAVLIINLLWIGLLAGGLYSFWQVSYKIVLFLVSGFTIFWVIGYFLGSYKNRAKRFFQIYRQLKIYRPQAKEEDILRETARLYFQNLRWGMGEINHTLELIFAEKDSEVKDAKELLHSVFIFENPSDEFGAGFNFEKYMKESNKKDSAIECAYKKVFGENAKVTKRPVLSKDALKRIREAGFNPDEMTNEQLAAFEGMDNIEKGHWLSKWLSYGSVVFGLVAVINLFALDFGAFVFSVAISSLLMYIAYRIQSRVTRKKFYEANILKWSQDQQKKRDE